MSKDIFKILLCRFFKLICLDRGIIKYLLTFLIGHGDHLIGLCICLLHDLVLAYKFSRLLRCLIYKSLSLLLCVLQDRFALIPFDRRPGEATLHPVTPKDIEAQLTALRARPLGPGSNLALAISFQAFNNTIFSMQTVYASMFAVISGILSSVLASGLIPVIEVMFNYTTDIKLLELANLNSPLLRELMLKAPGTYHHSVMVGNLVEGAA